MIEFDNIIKLTDEEFRLLRDFINSYCGIYFDGDSKFYIEKRLYYRLHQKQFKNYMEYYYFLKYDPNRDEELNSVVEVLTNNETYFFREQSQLKAFSEEILPEILQGKQRQNKKELNIWSAGCSTGEEPYTIAVLILEKGIQNRLKVEILGTDISQRVLKNARLGVYSKSSFRSTDEKYLNRYFEKMEGERFRIKDEVKSLVTFGHLNLMDIGRIKLLKTMDVIFCRNVLMYFDINARKKVIESFYDRLVPGGFLLLGHAESLMNLSTVFKLRHLKNDLVYQKPY